MSVLTLKKRWEQIHPKHQTFKKKMVSPGYMLICWTNSASTGSRSGISPVPSLYVRSCLLVSKARTYIALVSRYILSNVFLPQSPTGGNGETVAGWTNSESAGLVRSELMKVLSALTSPVCRTALSRERIRNLDISCFHQRIMSASVHGGSRAVIRIKKCD